MTDSTATPGSSKEPGGLSAFIRQLRQRNVFKVAVAYAITGWLLIEIVSNVFPIFNFPQWTAQFAILLVVLGFPIALVFAWIFELTPEGIKATATAQTPPSVAAAQSQKLNHLIVGLIGVAVLFLLVDRFALTEGASTRSTPTTMSDGSGLVTRVSLVAPANRPIFPTGYPTRTVAISPDGRTVVYVGRNLDLDPTRPGTRVQLLLRSLDSRAVRDLPDTFTARQPFFSPDGEWVGFFTPAGALRKVALSGGNAITLLENINGGNWAFGVWTADGNIIFSSNGKGLQKISAEGGTAVEITSLERSADGVSQHAGPSLLPDGQTVLFTVGLGTTPHIEALDLVTGERRLVLENSYGAGALASGHLLFHRDSTLMLAPFDTERLMLTGPAVPLDEDVRFDNTTNGVGQLDVSPNGTLVYVANIEQGSELGLVSQDGRFEALNLPPNNYALPRLAADGNRIAYLVRGSVRAEVHVYDLARGSTTRFTTDDESVSGMEWEPVTQAALLETRDGLVLRAPDRSRKLLTARPADVIMRNAAWSPDGTALAYTLQRGSQHDIWVVSNDDNPTASAWLATEVSEYSPAFSPDGRWLAYVSDESGQAQVYLSAYPQGERLAVSIAGGNSPVWSADGTQLYFSGFDDGARKMLAVTLAPNGASLTVSLPRGLFILEGPNSAAGAPMSYATGANVGQEFDVLPDGRFVMIRQRDSLSATEFVLVQNWFEEVRRLAPAAEAPQ
jgi:Tol biopolymer transport system component